MPIGPGGIAAITSGASLGGGIFSSLINRQNVKDTNKAQRELAEYQYEQENAQIAAQNAYNSPESQMARYQAAGLNPNLIYSQLASSNQDSHAEYKAPNLQAYTGFDMSIDKALSAASSILQMENMKSQNDAIKASTLKVEAETQGRLASNALVAAKVPFAQTLAESSSSVAQLNALNLAKKLDIQDYNFQNLLPARLDLLNKEKALKAYEIDLNRSGMQKNDPLPYRLLKKVLDGIGFDPYSPDFKSSDLLNLLSPVSTYKLWKNFLGK